MQRQFTIILGLILGLLAVRPALGQAALPGIPVSGMAAIVNDHVITFQEVQLSARRAMEAAVRQMRMTPEQLKRKEQEILRDSLEQLIDRRLILDEFVSAGYNLPDSIINDVVQAQIRDDFGDRVTLMKTLRKMGQTYEDYRNDQRDAFIIHSMTLKNVNQNVFISPRKIEVYYEDHKDQFKQEEQAKIRMIVLDKSKHALGEPVKLAAQIQERLAKGEEFAKLADEFSDDARRYKGGERGWIENKDSDLRKELRDIVFTAKPGEVSAPKDLDSAIFIIKVEERKPAGMKPLADVRIEIEQTLRTGEMERLRKQWIARLRKKSFIRYFN